METKPTNLKIRFAINKHEEKVVYNLLFIQNPLKEFRLCGAVK